MLHVTIKYRLYLKYTLLGGSPKQIGRILQASVQIGLFISPDQG